MRAFPRILGTCLLFVLLPAQSASEPWAPKSEPEKLSVIDSHMGVGWMPFYPIYFHRPYKGIQVYATIRPSYAKYFYPELEAHNIGITLNLSYLKLEEKRGFYKLDVVFRKYFSPMETRIGADSAFFGLGIGVTGILWGRGYVTQRDVTWVAELGYEYRLFERIVATVKAEGHRIAVGPANFTGLSVVVSLGWQLDS